MDATTVTGDDSGQPKPGLGAGPEGASSSDVRLNDFFTSRAIRPEPVLACPACGQGPPFKPFMIVKGTAGTEGEGVWMPATECRHCGMVFLNPRIPAEGAALFYRSSERLLGYFTTGNKQKSDSEHGFAPFARLIERAAGATRGDLLDIGCGAGAFLRFMSQRGFRVAGAEISPSVSEAARTRFSLDVMTAGADEAIAKLQQQGRTFDVVTMIHTFEHLTQPGPTLERLRSILKPGGLLALNVPNIRYFLVPLDRLLGTAVAGIWDSVSHFSYFSWRSLALTCERAGYTVVDRDSRLLVSGRGGVVGALDGSLSWLCRHLGGLGSNIAVIARVR
jgi:SAM-dependent methyltransferase